MSRVLLLSASMGAGHDTVCAQLAQRLTAAGHEAVAHDVLDLLPGRSGDALRGFYQLTIRRAPFVYSGIYAAFFRQGTALRPGSAPLAALAANRLADLVARTRPDAVVSVFHLAAQIAGRLRVQGRLGVPSAVVVTDFSVHRQWLHPGSDLTLCLTKQAADEARAALGRPCAVGGPLVGEQFRPDPPGAQQWRRKLAADGRRPVLLSAGAWGAGRGFAATARLLHEAGYRPVVLCGRNERLRAQLARVPGAVALGWVQEVPGLLGACAALIDNAAGQTALQALAVGIPVVGYRPIPGHGAEGVSAMAQLGLTDYALDSARLVSALDRLTRPGPDRDERVAAGHALFEPDLLHSLEPVLHG